MERGYSKFEHHIIHQGWQSAAEFKWAIHHSLQLKHWPGSSVSSHNQSANLDQLDFDDFRLPSYFRVQKCIYSTDRIYIRLSVQQSTLYKNRFDLLSTVPNQSWSSCDLSTSSICKSYAGGSASATKCKSHMLLRSIGQSNHLLLYVQYELAWTCWT
jgi:hypothetical protein